MKKILLISTAVLISGCGPVSTDQSHIETAPAQMIATESVLDGAWTEAQTTEILEKTATLKLNYAAGQISANERAAVQELLRAGERLHALYLDQVHPDARAAERALAETEGRDDLKKVFRIMKGPVATTLDNRRLSF